MNVEHCIEKKIKSEEHKIIVAHAFQSLLTASRIKSTAFRLRHSGSFTELGRPVLLLVHSNFYGRLNVGKLIFPNTWMLCCIRISNMK